jgi:hypothetical protein
MTAPLVHHRLLVKSLAEITEAYVTGRPVHTLCDRKLVLTRDPQELPLCPDCRREVISLGGVL